jgi:choline dehydrogenase-like flavoprotein
MWLDGDHRPFNPGNHYHPGGNSKFHSAVLMLYRAEDFAPLRQMGSTTQGWPFGYDALQPYYQGVEDLYQVRGGIGEDPTEPPHSRRYNFPLLPDEPAIADLRNRLRRTGLHPCALPLGVDLDRWLAHVKTPWDAFPNTCGGKMDAETIGLAHALQHPNVTLTIGAKVEKLIEVGCRIAAVEVLRAGQLQRLLAQLAVLAAGAVSSAVLLLKSANTDHAKGLANELCCTNPVRDSSGESSVIAGVDEQTEQTDVQDPELARVQQDVQAPWLADDPLAGRRLSAIAVRQV